MYIRSLKECKWNKYNKPEWQEFERLVRDCAAVEFGQEFHLFGRQGQNQHGIDIFSHDWKILIQCKAYKEDANIETEAKKDYQTAISYFTENGKPFFDRYIIATTLKTDGNAQIKLRNTGIEVWFWDDICRIIDNYKFHNDSDQFVEGFEEPLFLHRGIKNVCLKNLFVPQEYSELDWNNKYVAPRDDLEKRIKRFIQEEKHRLMIIEGDAGSGKSSLVGRLNFIAKVESDKKNLYTDVTDLRQFRDSNMFSGRPLVTIRLRDLRKKLKRNEYELGDAILEYMNIPEKRVFVQRFSNAVIVLDGFDELCMINGLNDYEDIITKFRGWAQDCKIIITSRPMYINTGRIRDCFLISLKHFNKAKRGKWLDKYKSLFPKNSQAVDKKVAEYIRNVSSDNASVICDTPLTLYLFVGSKATYELTENIWELYHHIFSKTVVETEYSVQMKPESGNVHSIGAKSELIYQITEEIAYRMFRVDDENFKGNIIKTDDGKFLITEEGIKSVIIDLLEKDMCFYESAKELGVTAADLKRSHALCCYWKTDTNRGPAEFYHNNIRDFFMCERIYRAVNSIYNDMSLDNESKKKSLAVLFIDMFRHGILNEMVCEFILWRSMSAVRHNTISDFPIIERDVRKRILPTLYEYMLLDGRLYNNLNAINLFRTVEHILHGTAQVYRYAYEPILERDEHILWWNDVKKINDSGIIGYVFGKFVGNIAYRADLRNADLSNIDLRSQRYLGNGDIKNVDLRGADFSGASLVYTTLTEGYRSEIQAEQIAHLKSLNIEGLKI